MASMNLLHDILRNNQRWVEEKLQQNSSYFQSLAKGQEPQVLWIGCSDSRVPPNIITGLDAGQIFVHRNIANQIRPDDLNIQSVVEYALQNLPIQYVVVCGHYGCGGIMAALQGSVCSSSNVGSWITGICDVLAEHREELEKIPSMADRANRLAELNVLQQVKTLSENPSFIKSGATILPWIFDINSGKIKDLSRREVYFDSELSLS